MTSECLVCTIVDHKVCLPISAVQGILPLLCTIPVPCTERWVLGLGLRDNRVFTVVSPAPHEEQNAAIDEEKMLLSRQSDADLNWALRIHRVLGMATISVDTSRYYTEGDWTCPADWFRPAKTHSGDAIAWLDPDAVSNSLARVGGGR